jgi:hypothetical protein
LAPVWAPAKALSFASVLHYYQPLGVFGSGTWPLRDVLALLLFAAATTLGAGLAFGRRDLRAA